MASKKAIVKATSVTVTDVSGLDLTQLDGYIVERVGACTKLYEVLNHKVSELLPALLEMEKRIAKGQGFRTDLKLPTDRPQTWHEYLESRGINPATFRQWKHRSATLKQIATLVEPNPRVPAPAQSSHTAAIKSTTAPVVAIPKPAPKLSPDINETLLSAAYTAAIDAANAVKPTDIQARYYPALMFYTSRTTLKFGRMLKEKGLESYSWRGKRCFDLASIKFPWSSQSCGNPAMNTPIFRTYEQAWAYAKGFAHALPDLDIGHAVVFRREEESRTVPNEKGDMKITTVYAGEIELVSKGTPSELRGG